MLFSANFLATASAAALIGLGEATSSSQSNSSSYLDDYTTPSIIYPGLTAGLGDPRVILPNSGVQVQGIVPADYPNINAFLGIPYGQPPVGALRFTPPQAYDYQSYHSRNTSGKVRSGRQSVNGDILADQLPPSCMQWLGNDTGIYNVDVTEFSIRGPISEDCLTLSMWTPRNASAGTYPNGGGYGNGTGKAELLPVLVFIPGGAFTTGGQNVPYQIPEKVVERRQDVIVVTINYRLNIFGFPNSKALTEQNLGLLDQRVALEWVAKNIEAFGGDPKRVVLWGQSGMFRLQVNKIRRNDADRLLRSWRSIRRLLRSYLSHRSPRTRFRHGQRHHLSRVLPKPRLQSNTVQLRRQCVQLRKLRSGGRAGLHAYSTS